VTIVRRDVRTLARDLERALADLEGVAAPDGVRGVDAAKPGSLAEAASAIKAAVCRTAERARALIAAALADETGAQAAHERDLDYLENLHPAPDPVLAEVERRGREDDIPIVDRETGRFLGVLVRALRPQVVVELGTAYGYSTLWMALALPPGGRIFTVDPDEERTARAAQYFARAGVRERIEILNRPALDVLAAWEAGGIDFLFIDAVKEEYSAYLRAAVPLLRPSGVLVADNLLWAHAASRPPSPQDTAATQAIRRFNGELLTHPQLAATIIPLGDGVGVAAKIA
jgi:predicted O-methyltransferase YrrM